MNSSSIDAGSRFLASTLHEVRTPIQTIIGTVELLSDTTLDKEQTEYVRQIEFSANVLLQLANDVLDFTKIRSKEFKLECIPYNAAELTEHVVDLISIEAFNHNLEVITNIDYSMPGLMGDPTRVQQIILNLIKNAVKFTPSGYIYVKMSHTEKYVLFEVRDSGIGIPEEKQSLIFKDFYQVDASTTRKYGGTGLGLSICKNLVEVMGGKIGVKSNPNGGSIFYFTLPYEPSEFVEGDILKINEPTASRILVIDDNVIALKSTVDKLMTLGITNISSTSSVSKAMELLQEATAQNKPFTVIFIDLIMPSLDGWKLATSIKNNTNIKRPKMYLMIPEGQMGKDAKMKMLDLYNGYLYKPIKRNKLYDILKEALTDKDNPLQNIEKDAPIKIEIPKTDDSTIAKGNKILVAEDHPVNRKLIYTFLTKFGATVYLAENGQEAVDQIKAHPEIDLVFMDIFMPVKNGIDATIEIRDFNYKGIIIACTANNDPAEFKEYTQMGVNDILIKPFKREAIKQMLEKWNTVLSFPEAKEIVSLADMNNHAAELWDIADFKDTTNDDKDLAVSVIQEYLTQTNRLLSQIKEELIKNDKDFDKLQLWAHTLKGSSASVSAPQLAEYAGDMEEAAKNKDSIATEASRIDFAIDFLKFKKLAKQWTHSAS